MTGTPFEEIPLDVISLLGKDALILHAPGLDVPSPGLGGRDVDCALSDLDPVWPLRLTNGWRLCQAIQYDLGGWYWVVERDRSMVAIDTIIDPLGLGRDGISTADLTAVEQGVASPATRAAYLTIKRIRKEIRGEEEWGRIESLASSNEQRYRELLRKLGGARLANLISDMAVDGRVPNNEVIARGRLLLLWKRFRRPTTLARAVVRGVHRYLRRVVQPTGLIVLVTGPDGAGKTTLTSRLPDLLDGAFKRFSTSHWRPGILPRPGALVGRESSDPSHPHGRRAFGVVTSSALLAYYWLDFLIGHWLRDWPIRVRSGLVIRERGWWDLAVDPLRYRLNVPTALVRALGSVLKHPDLVLVLEGSAGRLAARKRELPAGEIARQIAAWGRVLPRHVPRVVVDADRPAREVAARSREAILRYMEDRTLSRLGPGWISLPSRRAPRWWIPRGPWFVGRSALDIHQPMTLRGLGTWTAARAVARTGALRLGPRGSSPPRAVRAALAPHLLQGNTLAVARANHPGRYVALVLDAGGDCRLVAKIATDARGQAELEDEERAIGEMTGMLPEPIRAPHVLHSEPRLLLLSPISWRPRREAWRLDPDLSFAMGVFFRRGTVERNGQLVGPVHGDFAPWNVLRTADGWALIDWESWRPQGRPFHDVCHYLVQAYSLLGRPSLEELVGGFAGGRGWIGAALRSYAHGAELEVTDPEAQLREYLVTSTPALRPSTTHERRGIGARRRLLRCLEGQHR
jgi:hypothetical protein